MFIAQSELAKRLSQNAGFASSNASMNRVRRCEKPRRHRRGPAMTVLAYAINASMNRDAR